MSPSYQQLQDSALQGLNKLLGRSQPTWQDTAFKTWGSALSSVGFLLSLPMTVVSFLAIPFFGGTGTSLNLVFFYLTWSALIWTHSPRVIEIYGTLAVRTLAFLLPSLVFLAFDYGLPGAAASIKAGGKMKLPARLGQQKLINIVLWSSFNVLLGIATSTLIEMLFTSLFGFRTTLRVTMAVPLPWTMAKELLQALAVRGTLHYLVHRFVLHAQTRSSPLARWHKQWAHSVRLTFSLVAAYDHPACYLLSQWLPSFIPAVFWRMHILTWLLFQILVSLENLFIYSGYSALPSAIMLPGMVRRVDEHYATGGAGNFGHWGILDFFCRTGCAGQNDIMDDLQDEADKHQVRRRISDAVDDATDIAGDAKERIRQRRRQRREEDKNSSGQDSEAVQDSEEAENDSGADKSVASKLSKRDIGPQATKRRSKRGQ